MAYIGPAPRSNADMWPRRDQNGGKKRKL